MKRKKVFAHRTYRLDSRFQNKIRAYNRADKLRGFGYRARVAQIDRWTWGVWKK